MSVGHSSGNRSRTKKGTMPFPPRVHNRARNYQKATFKCGHRGLGGFCHRCAQADKLDLQLLELRGFKGKKEGLAEKISVLEEHIEHLRQVEG